MKINEKHIVRMAFVEKSYIQLNENEIVHDVCACLNVNKVCRMNGSMVVEVSLTKMIVFSNIKSALCFFLRCWWQRVALMKKSSQVFFFES